MTSFQIRVRYLIWVNRPQISVNGTEFIKKLADQKMPLSLNATDYCVNKVKSVELFNNMCDDVDSLTFELCQIQFINASHARSAPNTIGQWMKYRNLTDGETDLIAWFYKAMKHQISKSGF